MTSVDEFSWQIPYVKDAEKLVVLKWGFCYKWSAESTCSGGPMAQPQCPLPSGQYLGGFDERQSEKNEELRQAWLDAGWCAAEPINSKPLESKIDDNPEADEIPF